MYSWRPFILLIPMSENKEQPFLICILSPILESEEVLCLELEEKCFPSLNQN